MRKYLVYRTRIPQKLSLTLKSSKTHSLLHGMREKKEKICSFDLLTQFKKPSQKLKYELLQKPADLAPSEVSEESDSFTAKNSFVENEVHQTKRL